MAQNSGLTQRGLGNRRTLMPVVGDSRDSIVLTPFRVAVVVPPPAGYDGPMV